MPNVLIQVPGGMTTIDPELGYAEQLADLEKKFHALPDGLSKTLTYILKLGVTYGYETAKRELVAPTALPADSTPLGQTQPEPQNAKV